MKNKSSMLEKLLKRVGEYAEENSTRTNREPGDCLADTLKKTGDLLLFNRVYNPDAKVMDEILACYSMGFLTGEGVPILDVFNKITENFRDLEHREPAEAIIYVHDSVRQGDNASSAMSKLRFFSPETAYLTAIGEKIGEFDRTSKRAADFLQIKVEKNLTQEQIGHIVSLYAMKMLIDAGVSSEQVIGTLSGFSREYIVGPSPKVFGMLDLLDAKDYAEYGHPIKRLI